MTIADPPILYRPNTRRFGRFQGSKWEPSNQANCSQSRRTVWEGPQWSHSRGVKMTSFSFAKDSVYREATLGAIKVTRTAASGSVVETRPQLRQQLQRIKERFPYLTLSMKNANYNTFRLPLLLHLSRTQFWCIFGHISLNLTS